MCVAGCGTGVVTEIIERFVANFPSRLTALRDALISSDTHAIEQEARSLKSDSSNLGADRIAYLCDMIEQQGKTGDLAGLDEVLSKLSSEFEPAQPAFARERTSHMKDVA